MDTVAAAVVLAGGSGTRLGAGRNKVYLPLAGRPVLAWSLATFAAMAEIGPIVLVARPADQAEVRALLATAALRDVEVVAGGATRQASELAGLGRLADRIADGRVDAVLVHDGARPLVTAALARSVLRAARTCGGAVPAVACPDLGVVDPVTQRDGSGGTSVERLTGLAPPGLQAVQTPQGFRAAALLAACTAAAEHGFTGTDTASCVQRFTTLDVRRVPGDPHNLKVTYAHDLTTAARLRSGRVGDV